MPTPSITDFWRLADASQLLGPRQLEALKRDFSQLRGAGSQGNTRTLCAWLIDRRAMSRFQCDILLLGQPGPFQYGDYRILDRIGQGRLSRLFRAIHLPTGQEAILKFLSGPATQIADRMATLRATTSALAEAADPRLSGCYELLEVGAYKFAVIEALQGQSAAERLRASGRFAPADACAAARAVALSLAGLHGRGEVHGDVRPENVWCDAAGSVRLLGFPLARNPLGPPPGLDEWTADYAAPELAESPGAITPLTDIYALGCTLYELLTGKAPFADVAQRQTIAGKMARHAAEAIVPVDSHGPMPAGLNRVVSFMMAKNAAVRYQQMAVVAEELRAFASDAAPATPPATAAAEALREFCRRRPPMTAAAAANGGRPARPIVADAAGGRQAAGGIMSSAAPHSATTSVAPAASMSSGFAGPSLDELFRIEPAALAIGAAPAVGGLLAESAASRNRGPSRSRGAVLLVGGIMAALALLVGGLVAVQSHYGSPTPPASASKNAGNGDQAAGDPANADSSAAGGGAPRVVPDDGTSLWTSPTAGDPPQIKYLAPGVQILVVLRPQSLLGSPRGQQAIEALGPAGQAFLGWVEAQTGLKPAEIDRLDVGLYEAYGPRPVASLVAYVKNRPAPAALVARWGNPAPMEQAGHAFYQKDDRCYYLPPTAPQVIVVAPRGQLDDIFANADAPATLDANLRALVETSDVQRHVTAFFLPIYLLSARDTLYPGALRPVRDMVEWFLGGPDSLLCGAVSFEFSEPFFAELRVYPARNKKPVVTARDFHSRIDEWSQRVQGHLLTLSISPYSRDMLSRLPFMLESLSRGTRHGAEDRAGIVRCYLPGQAGADLALATDLLLLETAGVAAPSGGTKTGPPPATAKNVWDRLKQPVTVSFDRDSLENALKMLSTEMGVKIEIVGNDLKLDGITKNQPLALDQRNRPAEDVLNQIMLLCNPDRTVKKLSDQVQKLVYVVKPKYQGGEDVILITTRAKAAEHGDLPAVFKRSP